MRNWNPLDFSFLSLPFWFLQYLWGIETTDIFIISNDNVGFYSTYEELKLIM